MSEETICAISTAPGNGAISLIRLTGPEVFSIAERIFYSRKKHKSLKEQPTQTLHFGEIRNNNELIDEVLLAVFKQPHSYTGEDMVEISCHGSVFIQQTILHLLIKNGAQLAQPGEFTQRAYLNGKMDLSQAEAVADLIASQSEAAHKIAMNQMRGGFSHELAALRAQLLQFISLIELELDFSEEDVEFADRSQLRKLLRNIEKVITRLIKSFELGNAIKNGVPVAIVGEPNVGKSTLLNAILNEDKAIVSEIAGTTRDTIEDTFNYSGITYRFIDTAGLRHTTDTIESMGIERTYKKINQAKIVLALFDARDNDAKVISELEALAQKGASDKTVILVRNKIDLQPNGTKPLNHPLIFTQVNLSARNNQSVDVLLETIGKAIHSDALENNEVIVTNLRHIDALTQALAALQRALDGLEKGITNDFLAMDIREVIHFLAGITGDEISTEEILGNIFSQFCIGK